MRRFAPPQFVGSCSQVPSLQHHKGVNGIRDFFPFRQFPYLTSSLPLDQGFHLDLASRGVPNRPAAPHQDRFR